MGICESSNNDKNDNIISKNEIKDIKNEESETQAIDKTQKKKLEFDSLNQNSSLKLKKNSNNLPKLDIYERSIAKKSESSQTNQAKSDFSSNLTEEEIIIKGEINRKCPNKEKDFDNNSFMKLVKNNGGIILNEDFPNNSENNNNFKVDIIKNDLNKENLSEIKSHNSTNINGKSINSSTFTFFNDKKNKNYIRNTLKRDKMTVYSMKERIKIDKNIKNDNKSLYSAKTINPKINFNKYLNGIFNTDNFKNNHNNNNLYNYVNQGNFLTNAYNNNNYNYHKNSLISNHNNMTYDSTSDDLMGSFIGIPKIDERIPETDLNYGMNYEDIISDLSS